MSARLAAPLLLTIAACASTGQAPERLADAPHPSAWSQACKADDGWDDPGPPFRIHGNSYYVGTCGITAILIAGDEGHVIIDGATRAGGELIAANVEALGFRMADVKVLLHSHEHFDHVAGLASLQQRSGARVLASPQAAPVLARGSEDPADPQAGILEPFPAARVAGTVVPGEQVRVGNLSLTPIATPGHTAGALTWQWQACEGADCRTLVYADSLSAVSNDTYRYSDHPAQLTAFRGAIARMGALKCDVLLTPHPAASELHPRARQGLPADPTGCRRYAERLTARLDTRLAEEASKR